MTTKIKIHIQALLLSAAALLLATSCVNDRGIDDFPEGDVTDVLFTLSVSGQSPATRALTEEQDKAVGSVNVLVFYRSGDYAGKLAYSRIGTLASGNTYEVPLPHGNYDLMVLGNAAGIVQSAALTLKASTKADAVAALTLTHTGKWDYNKLLPLWGYKDNVTINATTSFTGDDAIDMHRMVARVDVSLSQEAASGVAAGGTVAAGAENANFALTDIYLVNYNTVGQVAPDYTDNTVWNPSGGVANPNKGKAVKPSTPSSPGKQSGVANALHYTATDGVTANAITRTVYTFEATNGNADSQSTNPCIIIGGSYKGGSTSYYRLDFVNRSGAARTYLNLLRNHVYSITIDKVLGAGSTTVEEAFATRSSNIVMNTLLWEEAGMNVAFNDQYFLGVSEGSFALSSFAYDATSSGNALAVTTDYPDGWTATIAALDPETGTIDRGATTPDWLSITPASAAAQHPASTTAHLILTANTTGENRSAAVVLQAGPLSYAVRVMQKWQSLRVFYDDNGTEVELTSGQTLRLPNATTMRTIEARWTPDTEPLTVRRLYGENATENLTWGIPSDWPLSLTTGTSGFVIDLNPVDTSSDPWAARSVEMIFTVGSERFDLSLVQSAASIVLSDFPTKTSAGATITANVKANFTWTAAIDKSGLTAGDVTSTTLTGGPDTGTGNDFRYTFSDDAAGKVSFTFTPAAGGLIDAATGGTLAADGLSVTPPSTRISSVSNANANILYYDAATQTMQVGEWGADGEVNSTNILGFKFGSVFGFDMTTATYNSTIVKFKPYAPDSFTLNNWSNIPAYTYSSTTSLSADNYHNISNVKSGKGDPCRLVGMTQADITSFTTNAQLYAAESGWRLPTPQENFEFIGWDTAIPVGQSSDFINASYFHNTRGHWVTNTGSPASPAVSTGTQYPGSYLPVLSPANTAVNKDGVFLPAMGVREGSNGPLSSGTGVYWSSKAYDATRVNHLFISSTGLYPARLYTFASAGAPVRCVRDESLPRKMITLSDFPTKATPGATVTANVKANFAWTATIDKSGLTAGNVTSTTLSGGPNMDGGTTFSYTFSNDVAGKVSFVFTPTAGGSISFATGGVLAADGLSATKVVRTPSNANANILYYDAATQTMQVGEWGADGDVNSTNILGFKFGSVFGLDMTTTPFAASAIKFHTTKLSTSLYTTWAGIPVFSFVSVPNISDDSYHNLANVQAGKGDPCRLVGMTRTDILAFTTDADLYAAESGWRLPTPSEYYEFIGWDPAPLSPYINDYLSNSDRGYWATTTTTPAVSTGTQYPGGYFPASQDSNMDTGGAFLPAMGSRYHTDGSLSGSSTDGVYWSSEPQSSSSSKNLVFNSTSAFPYRTLGFAAGMAVRCVRDESLPRKVITLSGFPAKVTAGATVTANVKANFAWTATIDKSGLTAGNVISTTLSGGPNMGGGTTFSYTFTSDAAGKVSFVFTPTAGGLISVAPGGTLAADNGSVTVSTKLPSNADANILHYDEETQALQVGDWGVGGTANSDNILGFKFGSLVGFEMLATGTMGSTFNAANHVKFKPVSTLNTSTWADIPYYTYNSAMLNISADNYHNLANVRAGKGDPCRLVGMSQADIAAFTTDADLYNAESGWRLPTVLEGYEFVGWDLDATPPSATYDDRIQNSDRAYWAQYVGEVPPVSTGVQRAGGFFPVSQNSTLNTGGAFLPAIQNRRFSDGFMGTSVSTYGYYWLSLANSTSGYQIYFTRGRTHIANASDYTTGNTVRCVRDESLQNRKVVALSNFPGVASPGQTVTANVKANFAWTATVDISALTAGSVTVNSLSGGPNMGGGTAFSYTFSDDASGRVSFTFTPVAGGPIGYASGGTLAAGGGSITSNLTRIPSNSNANLLYYDEASGTIQVGEWGVGGTVNSTNILGFKFGSLVGFEMATVTWAANLVKFKPVATLNTSTYSAILGIYYNTSQINVSTNDNHHLANVKKGMGDACRLVGITPAEIAAFTTDAQLYAREAELKAEGIGGWRLPTPQEMYEFVGWDPATIPATPDRNDIIDNTERGFVVVLANAPAVSAGVKRRGAYFPVLSPATTQVNTRGAFLPAYGYRFGNNGGLVNSSGDYWTSTVLGSNQYRKLSFGTIARPGDTSTNSYDANYVRCVRNE